MSGGGGPLDRGLPPGGGTGLGCGGAGRRVPLGCDPRPGCFLCGRPGGVLYDGLRDWHFGVPGRWALSQCASCGVAWLNPLPSAASVPSLYAGYHTHTAAVDCWGGSFRAAVHAAALRRDGHAVPRRAGRLARLASRWPGLAGAARLELMGVGARERGAVLDVGCGSGSFLRRMRSLGWAVSGTEPDPHAAAAARAGGIEVICGYPADLPAERVFDLVTLSHVIEHVPDPVALLRDCRARLSPGGRLVVTTPNLLSIGHRWFGRHWRGLEPPRHFVLFSPEALLSCARRAGLSPLAVCTAGRMARDIYCASATAARCEAGSRPKGGASWAAKAASFCFQVVEDVLVGVCLTAGEEIVLTARCPGGATDGAAPL